MLDRLLSVVVALSLALLVWLYARSRDQEILDNVVVPVRVSLAGQQAEMYSLEPNGPSEVMATFTGSPSRIRELRGLVQRKELVAQVSYVVLEEHKRKARYSDTVLVDARALHAPSGVTVSIVDSRNRVPVTVQRLDLLENVVVPVHLKMPDSLVDQFVVDLAGPAEVLATFTGPPARIREVRSQLEAKTFQAVVVPSVPADRRQEGRYADTLIVQPRDLVVPAGVTVTLPEGRDRIAVTVNKVVEKMLPVHLDGAGDEAGGSVLLEPSVVTVRGPKEVLDRARFITAQPGMLPLATPGNVGFGGAGRLTLVQELEGKPVKVTPRTVVVRLLPQNRQVYELTDVPIHFLMPVGFTLRPGFANDKAGKIGSLKVQGPAGLLEMPHVYAFIDLTAKPTLYDTGVTNELVHVQLPRDFVLAPSETTTRSANFILYKPDPLPSLSDPIDQQQPP